MNKLYPYLHNVNGNFKKQFLSISLLLFLILHIGTHANAQCVPPPAPVVTPNPAFMCLGDPAVKLKVASLSFTSQFCSGPVNIPVPDNNPAGASNSITVSGLPANCNVTSVVVTINMSHTWIGDMVFVLRAPNGQIINLDYRLSATGGNSATSGFVNSIISSTGTVALSTGTNPYTGTFRADAQVNPAGGFGLPGPTGMQPTGSNWAALTGSTTFANGNWTLGFYDGGTGDLGTLTSWCVRVNYFCGVPATPAVWSPSAGLFHNATATIPYIAGSAVDSVWARPTPAGTYTYAVTTQSLPVPPATFTNPATISIPVGGSALAYPSDLPVSGLPTTGVTVKSIVLNGVSHTRSNDMDVLLQSPTGQNVILMSDVGGTGAINATYTFVNAGAGNMGVTSANPTGSYLPTNSGVPENFPAPGPGTISQASPTINMFTGNMNGTWKLFVFDDDGTGDQGLISGGYTINFDTATLCYSAPTLVMVTVGGSPISITAQPVNKTICSDGVAGFTVAATGGGTLSYQWQVSSNGGATYTDLINGGVYGGVTTPSLTVTAPPVTMSSYRYRVVINGTAACGPVTSGFAVLTVNPLPIIVISANPLIVLPGMPTTIHSTVSPNPAATYTWFRNGSVVAGATADSLVVDINGLGDYQLSVTDINGCSSLSNIITITDHFALNLFVYPNPSGGILQVRYYSDANTILPRSLIVYDNRGLQVITKSFIQTVSFQRVDLDIRPFGKGLYWVALVDQNGKRLAMSRAVVQ